MRQPSSTLRSVKLEGISAMRIEAHIEKFKRFDALRSRFDPQADFELWYWMTLNAGTAIINAAAAV